MDVVATSRSKIGRIASRSMSDAIPGRERNFNGCRNSYRKAADGGDVVLASNPQRYGTHLQASGRSEKGHAAVPGRKAGALAALARHASHGSACGRPPEMCGLRPLPHHLSVELHSAGAG